MVWLPLDFETNFWATFGGFLEGVWIIRVTLEAP